MASRVRLPVPTFVLVTVILAVGAASLVGYFLVTLRSLSVHLPTTEVIHRLADEVTAYHLLTEVRHAGGVPHPGGDLRARMETVDVGIAALLSGGHFAGERLIRVDHPLVRSYLALLDRQTELLAATAARRSVPLERAIDPKILAGAFHQQFVETRRTLDHISAILADHRRADQRALGVVLVAVVFLVLALTAYGSAIVWARRRDARRFVAELQGEIAKKEAAVRAADQAAQAKSAFLSVMSHELRTPLNAIIGFSEMMQVGICGPVENERHRTYLAHIQDSGRRLLELVTMVLDYSRADAGRLELTCADSDIGVLIGRRIAEIAPTARNKSIRLVVDRPDVLPRLSCDPRLVGSVLANALSNAVKFTPTGGTVRVATGVYAEGFAIAVADDGIGMSAQEQRIAMQPFGQVDDALSKRQEGAGLGLPFSKLVMQAHGGDLALASRPGGGTTVTLAFPAARIRSPEIAPPGPLPHAVAVADAPPRAATG